MMEQPFLGGCLGSAIGKDNGRCSARRCRRIGQSVHGVTNIISPLWMEKDNSRCHNLRE